MNIILYVIMNAQKKHIQYFVMKIIVMKIQKNVLIKNLKVII